jgi:uncharacterized metal-binding protein
MSSGKFHRTFNTVASVPITGALIFGLGTPVPLALSFAAGYTIATYFINPDLDLYSDGYQSWGIFRFYWYPYQKILAHRSFLSHAPIVGTLFRIAYLLTLPVLVLLLVGTAARNSVREALLAWIPQFLPYILMFILGMVISDALHLVLDVTSTSMKRTFKIGKRSRPRYRRPDRYHATRR